MASWPGRVRLDLAYLGTQFHGWQTQAPPLRTVQGVLEESLSRMFRHPVAIHGAGRTDAGVHATGQVAHFDVPEGGPRIPKTGLQRGLNSVLPDDIRVTRVEMVDPGWHARFSAIGKLYVYRLRRGEYLLPHEGLVEARAREPLDLDAMRAAAARLVGRRDFARFSLAGGDVTTTVRHLFSLEVLEEGAVVLFRARGDGFLRGMVRRLVGTLRDVGRGRTLVEAAFDCPGPPAEARGLTLERVFYAGPASGGA